MSSAEELETRFASLEIASRNLSGDVHALNATLLVVADLQREQREQAMRQEKTEHDLAISQQISAERDARTRTFTRYAVMVLATLLPLVTVLVYLSLVAHVNQLLNLQNVTRYTNCNTRNNETRLNQQREAALGRLEKDPQISRLHEESAANLAHSFINCEQYKVVSK